MVNILCNGRKKLSSYNIQYSSQGDGLWATACQMENGIQEMKLINFKLIIIITIYIEELWWLCIEYD